ncbi:S49 family peptidase [Methylosinus sp. PW1]|uniref:S49 family peptidase n=1 Tax=Methylosinus sp. PW1 TaxID=107636 RepID=UPI00068B1216|nr:S49 family peptidase [Methylosinus sp. PW1]
MRRNLAQIALAAFETPLLLHPRKAEVIASVLAEHMDGVAPMLDLSAAKAEVESARSGRSQMLDRFDGERRGPRLKDAYGDTYVQTRYLFKDGLALVTVEGSLVNRGAWIGAPSGLTSYEGVMAQLASAAADREVERIIVDFDSPGGEAVGAFEMADVIRSISAEKPIVALVNGMAASAAYAMASGAWRIITTPSGISGSIGVVMLHLDQSRRMDKLGVTPTLIYAGGHKVDGNPFEPLPESVRADLQAEVDQLYSMFVRTVAKGRRGLTEEAIRATEARTFIGADAVSAGLADDVGTLADLFSSLKSSSRIGGSLAKGPTMDVTDIPRAEHNAAVATARAEGRAEGRNEGLAAGASGERERIGAILGHANAKGRESLAQHFAFKTSMSPDAAAEALAAAAPAASPPPAVPEKTHRLDALVPNPKVDVETQTTAESLAAGLDAAADRMIANMRGR